jgi:hypothetical protein
VTLINLCEQFLLFIQLQEEEEEEEKKKFIYEKTIKKTKTKFENMVLPPVL